MKINRIYVENYKPVEKQELDLQECSAIITAGNNCHWWTVDTHQVVQVFRGYGGNHE